ncbi:tripartite tricarboxylate transporter permease [Nocardioides convexus]|uniref:tripartite tricarboxylate transporter permease n=1 Tax=Nocardioides convexus TaxID=2712224 RepID=UPI0024187518|nr:tripartite tricarboxylate transporter permease [Nocardioides convexus]
MDLLLDGFQTAVTPENLLFALIGVLLGTAVGVLPGIGPAMALALLLPVTYSVGVDSAIIMFAGIYYGGMYGGSTTSILLNTPGESSSVITAIEGNKMAKSGRAAQALATAAIGSFVAGTIGTVLLWVLVPRVADVVVRTRRAVVLRGDGAGLLRRHHGAGLLEGCAASSRSSSA